MSRRLVPRLFSSSVSSCRRGVLLVVASLMACASEIDDKVAAEVQDAKSAPAATVASGADWTLAPASRIEWVGAKVTDDHTGGFKVIQGSAKVEGGALVGAAITIDTSSLFADHPKLEQHLKGEDFFHVAIHPKAEFTITSVVPGDAGNSTVTGTLDLHGVRKEIAFPATVSVTGKQASVSAEFTLNRKDFGMVYPGKPDDLIRAEVLVKGTLVFEG